MLTPGLLYEGIQSSAYHADPAITPSLSSHVAATLLAKSPRHVFLEHPRLGGKPERTMPTDGMLFGAIAHTEVLGGGEEFVLIDHDDFRTKAAREERDLALAAGKIPVIRVKYTTHIDKVQEIAKACHLDYSGWLTESTIIWESGGAMCRARPDALLVRESRIEDLKFVENAMVSASARNVIANGYHIQAAAYLEAVEAVHPRLAGSLKFTFRFVETSPPYEMLVAELAGSMLEYGQRQWRRAKGIWARCTSSGEWPGYSKDPIRIECPAWALTEEMEKAIGHGSVDLPF